MFTLPRVSSLSLSLQKRLWQTFCWSLFSRSRDKFLRPRNMKLFLSPRGLRVHGAGGKDQSTEASSNVVNFRSNKLRLLFVGREPGLKVEEGEIESRLGWAGRKFRGDQSVTICWLKLPAFFWDQSSPQWIVSSVLLLFPVHVTVFSFSLSFSTTFRASRIIGAYDQI